MIKKNEQISGKSHNVDFFAERKKNYAPIVIEEFTDDDGEIHYILENGNTQKKTSYERIWQKSKGVIKNKNFKGLSIVKSHIL